MILAGDIGGTHTRLGLFAVEDGRLKPAGKKIYPSKDYPALEPILRDFMAGRAEPVSGACFGIAGPVVDNQVKTPNLPWLVDAGRVSGCLGLDAVFLINDLEATGYGALTLDAGDFVTLNSGIAAPGAAIGLIAAGTGLGETVLFASGAGYRVLPSEAGHADFAARTPLEIELLTHLSARFGRVSYERVISGPGIFNIYNFLKDSGRFVAPPGLAERLAAGDPAAVISQAALSGAAEICVAALNLFVAAYGAEAGNLALRAKALGGIYVGGGIAPKILSKLTDGDFMRAFADKGRYREFLSRVPVRVILNDETALKGAAHYAAFHPE